VVGLIVLIAIQFPTIEQSFLGAPDREMMEAAFKLRTDLIAGVADPVLFLDIDDHTVSRLSPGGLAMPPDTVPRGVIASLLDFIRTAPPNQVPRVVVLDVDIAQPPSDGADGVARLEAELAQWSASPTAPPLIISRQPYPSVLFGLDDGRLVLPNSPYDDIVQRAPNIYWGSPRVMGDQNGEIREFDPYECVISRTGVAPLYSVAMLAYSFAERDLKVLEKAPVRHWIQDGADHCRKTPKVPLFHGERIDFHFSLDLGYLGRVWPDLAPAWPGFRPAATATRPSCAACR
jgi:hypothetical protein